MSIKPLNYVLRRYYRLMLNAVARTESTIQARVSLSILRTAVRRRTEDPFADVTDLNLESALDIAHKFLYLDGPAPQPAGDELSAGVTISGRIA